MIVDELVKIALVGAARGTALPQAEGPLGEAIATSTPEAAAPEARLLTAVAIASRYEACGRTPAKVDAVPAPAPTDVMPACTRRAAELLDRILAMTNTPAKQQLLDEWLTAALAARQRAPHALLPAMLDYAASYRALRDKIAAAGDARATWLMSLNPRWQVAVGEQEDFAAVWSTGSREQRVSALRRLRSIDPPKAIELIQSTWKEDGADERAAFVETLSVGLTSADEPFLESALDDKSKQVRRAVVDLLARLPTSAYINRMAERAAAMLQFSGGKVEVTLPAAFDPAWQRDGIEEKAAQGTGQKQWWLQQIVAVVPPSHWSTTWKVAPADCVSGLPQSFAGVVAGAWRDASRRHPDAGWIRALLLNPAKKESPQFDLLNTLTPEPRQAIVTDYLSLQKPSIELLSQLLQQSNFSFDVASAKAIAEQIDRHVASSKDQYDYRLAWVLENLGLRFPPSLYPELASRWTAAANAVWETNRKPLDGCLQTLQSRYDIQTEFAR